MKSKETGELTGFITPEGEVEIKQTGMGFKYEISVSSVDQAITELCLLLAWLEREFEAGRKKQD